MTTSSYTWQEGVTGGRKERLFAPNIYPVPDSPFVVEGIRTVDDVRFEQGRRRRECNVDLLVGG